MKKQIAIGFVLAGCVLMLACAARTPSAAVQSFYQAAAAGKTDDAIDLLSQRTINTLGKDKLRLALQEMARKAQRKGGMKDLQITNEQVNGDAADVSFVLKYGDGTTETDSEHLVKENGGWRLEPKK